jgi:hypothetical protein
VFGIWSKSVFADLFLDALCVACRTVVADIRREIAGGMRFGCQNQKKHFLVEGLLAFGFLAPVSPNRSFRDKRDEILP